MCLWRRLTICGDLSTVNPFNTAGPIRGSCFIVRNTFPRPYQTRAACLPHTAGSRGRCRWQPGMRNEFSGDNGERVLFTRRANPGFIVKFESAPKALKSVKKDRMKQCAIQRELPLCLPPPQSQRASIHLRVERAGAGSLSLQRRKSAKVQSWNFGKNSMSPERRRPHHHSGIAFERGSVAYRLGR